MGRVPDMDLSDEPRPMPNRRSESDGRATGRTAARPKRERLAGAARTLAWLVPLTLLIWVYAEREQTFHTPFPIGVTVHVTTSVADRFVEFAGATQTPTINLKMSGPQTGVDEVKAYLADHGLTIDLGGRRPGRNQQVTLADLVQNLPLFKTSGVSVDDVQPPDLYANVDLVVDQEALVELDAQHAQNLLVPATFDPPRVRLHGPATQLASLREYERPTDGVLRVYADLGKFDRALQRTGEVQLRDVPLSLPLAPGQVHIGPSAVTVRLQLRAADESVEIQSVPVKVSATTDLLQQYDVTIEPQFQTLGHVTVTGPPRQIEEITSRRASVVAELDVTPADAIQDQPRRTLRYVLPEGVKVSPEDANRLVPFTMSRRVAAGG